ncbi:cell division protein FtsQ/DivIB, partial [Phaeospirillum tilakii]
PAARPGRATAGRVPPSEPRPPRARRRPTRLRLVLTPLQKAAALGVAATALFVAGAILWQSGVVQQSWRQTGDGLLRLTAAIGFRTSEITVSGRRRIPADQIVAALGARNGDPILGLDIVAARQRLEALPGVRAAVIERRLPGSLHLEIVEREPVALWQHDGAYTLVDRDGREIPGAIEGFEDLPLVVGVGAQTRAAELLTLLASEPELATRVKAATRIGERRWNLLLDGIEDGIEVRLPEIEPETAWHRLAELERNRGLSGRAVAMIDLRVPDRLVLRPGRNLPQNAERPPAPLPPGAGAGSAKED